ncbi:MAG: hemoglobin [Pseudohongiellaceae bacterium]|jgi:hemoglobin
MPNDIENEHDVEQLIKHFYVKVLNDPLISFIFTDIAKIDLEAHLPKIASFWKQLILPQLPHGQRYYRGRTFEIHQGLNRQCTLNEHHFQRWVLLFSQTVDDYFSGPRASLIKQKASAIAASMHKGLNHKQATEHFLRHQQTDVQFFDPQHPPPL